MFLYSGSTYGPYIIVILLRDLFTIGRVNEMYLKFEASDDH